MPKQGALTFRRLSLCCSARPGLVSSLRTAVDVAAEIQAAKRARSLASAGSGTLSQSLSAMELDGHGAREPYSSIVSPPLVLDTYMWPFTVCRGAVRPLHFSPCCFWVLVRSYQC